MDIRRYAAAVVLGSLVPLTAAVSPAQAQASSHARISAFVSDSTPASGHQFIVRGRLLQSGDPAPGRPVKVQAYRGGHWSQLSGARVTTNSHGWYRVRVILSQTGQRPLRMVGVTPKGSRNAFNRFTVTVH